MPTPRRDWRGLQQSTAFSVDARRAFGWKVHRHILQPGASLVVVATRDVPRAEAPNLALYVRGRASVTNSLLGEMPNRTPGLFTGDRPDHPAGTTKITAINELEFWCFNWHANRGALPVATPLRATNGEIVELVAGQRVLVCRGSLGANGVGPFVADGAPLAADGPTFGFLIGGDRG